MSKNEKVLSHPRYDEPHNHESQWCICWTLGSFAVMSCRGTCHIEADE